MSPSSVKRTELIKTNFPLPFVKKNITLGHMDYCEVFPFAQKCPAAAGYSLNKLRVMCNVVSPQDSAVIQTAITVLTRFEKKTVATVPKHLLCRFNLLRVDLILC